VRGGLFVDGRRRVALLAGLGGRRWERDLHSTPVVSRTGALVRVSGLREVYSWVELQAGIRWTILATQQIEWVLEGCAIRTIHPTMEPYLGARPTLDLGARFGARGGTTFRLAISRELFVSVGLEAETYSFGASGVALLDPADPTSGVVEPDSSTRTIALQAGVGGRF
jgi:hypothetical protein